jgi:hypothetical protein
VALCQGSERAAAKLYQAAFPIPARLRLLASDQAAERLGIRRCDVDHRDPRRLATGHASPVLGAASQPARR